MNQDPRKTPEPPPAQKTPVIVLEPVMSAPMDPLARNWVLRPMVLVIGGFVLLVWSIIGFYLWIPLLIRMCAAFSVAIVGAVVSGHDMSPAERALSEAIGFYFRGFSVIYQSVRRVWDGKTTQLPQEGQMPISWKRSIIEFCLASVMWAAPFVIPLVVRQLGDLFDAPAYSNGWR
ncbi:MAG: hypothetical protein Q8M07_26500 [Prosthecobacter sp.]|nr:hypothetical protein [Prosthecobacter sp.]